MEIIEDRQNIQYGELKDIGDLVLIQGEFKDAIESTEKNPV